jgi:polyisoprenoid-binding protein YceI
VDSKFVNISFESKMDVEDIVGTSRSVSGTARLGSNGSFDIVVPVESLRTGIEMRDEHLRGEYWLNAAKYPEIRFHGTGIKDLGGGVYEVSGKFALHGVEKPLVVKVQVANIPAAKAAAVGMENANWIRVRASFKVKLSDFGVKVPDMAAAKVSDEWSISLSLFGKEVGK